MFNSFIFNQKIETLQSLKQLNSDDVSRFGAIISTLNDWDLFRINPLKFAEIHGFEKHIASDLFIAGAKIGLFDFNYNLICPSCTGIEFSHHSIDEINPEHFHCSVCNLDVSTALDDQVEVSFTIHPTIKKNEINPYQNLNTYTRYFFSNNFERSEQLDRHFYTSTLGFFSMKPDTAKKITFKAKPNTLYAFNSMGNHCTFNLTTTEELSEKKQDLSIGLLDGTYTPKFMTIPSGDVTIKIANLTKNDASVLINRPDWTKVNEIKAKFPTRQYQWMTGKMLLNNQTFRELFRIQSLSSDLRLNLKSLTVLFTDLRGSTEMYDKAGDFTAYQMVQEHFDILTQIVRKYSGAVVKTMGDAIMATFSHPTDGLLASIDMIIKIEELNDTWKKRGYEIGLKVGLHEGSTLAVNVDDRLDYFGQSVNIAARVQGLAKAGEIIVTDAVFNFPGVKNAIQELGYESKMEQANLKGVGQTATVHKIFKAA